MVKKKEITEERIVTVIDVIKTHEKQLQFGQLEDFIEHGYHIPKRVTKEILDTLLKENKLSTDENHKIVIE